jgi:hypothetical protein
MKNEINSAERRALLAAGDQQKAIDQIIDWYALPIGNKFFKLSGKAGAGKSYTAAKALEELIQLYPTIRIKVIAPSHKAKKAIRAALGDSNRYEYGTVCQQLGKAPEFSEGTEKFVKKDKGVAQITEYDLIVCDEYGMISTEEAEELIATAFPHKILFLGDCNQLPPVGEKKSYIASIAHWPSFTLDKIVRYGGDIAAVANSYTVNCGGDPMLPLVSDDESIVVLPNRRAALELFADDVAIMLEKRQYNLSKWITWRNKTAQETNFAIREFVFNNPSQEYVIGDRLLARKPVLREDISTGKRQIVCENSTEFSVIATGVEKEMKIDGYTYECYVVPSKSDEGQYIDLICLASGQESQLNAHMEQLRHQAVNAKQGEKKKAWAKYYTVHHVFDDIAYAYAITCHKSQGSTYQYVFIDDADLRACPDRMAIFYTAITRAADTLYTWKI